MDYLEHRFPDAYGVVQSHVTKDEKRPPKIIRGVVPEEDKKQKAIDKKREAIDWENRFIKQQQFEFIDARLVLESRRRQTQKERMSDISRILELFIIIRDKLENYETLFSGLDLDKVPDDIKTFLSKIKSNGRDSLNFIYSYVIRLHKSDGDNYTNTFQVLYDFIYEFSPILREKYQLTRRFTPGTADTVYTLEGNPVEDDSTCTGASCGGLFDWFRKGGTRRKIKKNKSKKRKSKKRKNRIR